MSAHDDALDRLLDGLAHGPVAVPCELDRATGETTRALFHAGRKHGPSPDFVERLEATLMERFERVPSGPVVRVASPGLGRGGRSIGGDWWGGRAGQFPRAVAALAVAAVLVIASFAMSGRGTEDRVGTVGSIVAPVGSDPSLDACKANNQAITDANEEVDRQFQRVLYVTIPSVERPAPARPDFPIQVIPQSVLPAGPDVDTATRGVIEAKVREEYACSRVVIRAASATPETGTGRQRDVPAISDPTILSMSALSDGRVGVLVSPDVFGNGVKMYMIYAPYKGDWVYDEVANVGTEEWIASGYEGEVQDTVEIEIWDGLTLPSEVAIPADRPVIVKVVNHGRESHRFTMPIADISIPLAPGDEKTLQIVAPAGGHYYAVDNINEEFAWVSGGYLWARGADVGSPSP